SRSAKNAENCANAIGIANAHPRKGVSRASCPEKNIWQTAFPKLSRGKHWECHGVHGSAIERKLPPQQQPKRHDASPSLQDDASRWLGRDASPSPSKYFNAGRHTCVIGRKRPGRPRGLLTKT